MKISMTETDIAAIVAFFLSIFIVICQSTRSMEPSGFSGWRR
jgi:hypothetical protein